jgi:hypothetical protein
MEMVELRLRRHWRRQFRIGPAQNSTIARVFVLPSLGFGLPSIALGAGALHVAQLRV